MGYPVDKMHKMDTALYIRDTPPCLSYMSTYASCVLLEDNNVIKV